MPVNAAEGSAMPAHPSPNDLTRHQLDELDSLLQRMLQLPLASVPSESPTAPVPIPKPELPSGWRTDAAAGPRSTHLADTPAIPVFSSAHQFAPVEANKRVVAEPPAWGPDPLARYQPNSEPTVSEATPARDRLRLFGPPQADQDIPPSTGPGTTTGTLRGVDAPATPAGFRSQLADLAPPTPVETQAPVLLQTPATMETETESEPEFAPVPLLLWPLFALNWILETTLSLFGPLGKLLLQPIGKHALAGLGVILIVAGALWSANGLGWVQLPIPR